MNTKRYTNKSKVEVGYVITNPMLEFPFRTKQAIDKLGQLEDIEEELGIDLITLLKTKNVIYVKDALGCIHKVDTKDYGLNINLMLKAIILSRNYYFIDYGKTWAFTKEELE